jgi:hypothetical protein
VTFKDDRIWLSSPGRPTCGTYFNTTGQPGNSSGADLTATRNSMASCGTPYSNSGGFVVSINGYPYYGNGGVTGTKFLYTEVDCGGRRSTDETSQTGAGAQPEGDSAAIGWGNYSVDHGSIHGCWADVVGRDNTHVTNSYLWGASVRSECFLAWQQANAWDTQDCDHNDNIFDDGPTNVDGSTTSTYAGNMIVADGTSAVAIYQHDNGCNYTCTLRNVSITNNWFTGAMVTIREGGNGTLGTGSYINLELKNNLFLRHSSSPFAESGPYSGFAAAIWNYLGANVCNAYYYDPTSPPNKNFPFGGQGPAVLASGSYGPAYPVCP